ncbi:hypothetical protein RRG08_066063 [Elysia crispata]|uniref:Endonuclease/exonuclease/phosphatase domain-containing protein n=1 Tax=Elysia crispata TaxID=231223 RepID=A0AAE1BC75_9GAST|nr:hypothetical protein RRG08_066063 [Elysia crispata]
MGLTTPPRKKGSVTETRTDSQSLLSTLGEDGDSDSAPELMMARGESRKDLSDRTPSSSARSLRIASWKVRTLFEAGKCVQATREMQRYRLDILGLYAPTNAASEEEKEEFYDQLQRITEKLPRKDVNIIMGDANAKVGSDISYEEVMGKQGLGGNKITDFGITLKNRFQPLEHLDEDMETYWSQVKDSFISTCKEVLGEKDYKHKDWISQESLNRLSERREKKAAVNNSRTRNEKEAAQREYSDAAKEVKRSIKNDKEAFTNELAEREQKRQHKAGI